MGDTTGGSAFMGRTRDGGFTLIESIIASGIMVIVAAGVLTTLMATANWYAQTRARTEAYSVANSVMSLILARNAADIRRPVGSETWPTAIPETMPWASAIGTYTVETSLVPQVDPATGLDVVQVIVVAYPEGRPISPTVSVIRYASGWQDQTDTGSLARVTVEVQIVQDLGTGVPVPLAQSGVRIQLLDPVTLSKESYYAVTNADGVATIPNVKEGQYFLTSDPRFGTDVRPLHFPQRIYPTYVSGQTGAINQKYTLLVTQHSTAALLSVGAYRNAGWYNGRQLAPGVFAWDIVKPYAPVDNLYVYARPILNVSGTESSIPGAGPSYPTTSQLGFYRAKVNAYGIARIEIPWTVDVNIGQYWEVAIRVANPRDGERVLGLVDAASGGWDTPVDKTDLQNQTNYSILPQFHDLVDDVPIATSPW